MGTIVKATVLGDSCDGEVGLFQKSAGLFDTNPHQIIGGRVFAKFAELLKQGRARHVRDFAKVLYRDVGVIITFDVSEYFQDIWCINKDIFVRFDFICSYYSCKIGEQIQDF